MKISRSKNAVRNMRMGLLSKIVSMLCPFIIRTVFIRTLGAEYLGVNSLFTSVLSVLNLAELGFGSAIVFNMYSAIANDDDVTINAMLHFYKKVYRSVGLVILGIGLLLIPFLPNLTKGSYPSDINPLIVYLVYLINTVLSYFLFAYLTSLIQAFQRNDVSLRVGMYMNILMYILQIVLLVTVKNYYAYLSIMPAFTILGNLRTAIIAKKMFPQYKPMGTISDDLKKSITVKVRGLMIQKVCAVSRNAFDSIFVSVFLGLTEIAIYNNYYYIINTVTGFLTIVSSATIAGVGNSVATETKEKNHQDMMRMNFVYMWVSGWCTTCLICLYQDFMTLWAGKDLLLPMSSVILFCVYFYVLKMGDIRSIYVDATGIWWQTRFRALLEATSNIILNYFLGKYFGINGIIFATLISLFVFNFCYGSQLIYKYYFTEQNKSGYFIFHLKTASVTAIVCCITYILCGLIPGTYLFFVVKMFICLIVPNILFYLIYHQTKTYKHSVKWLLQRLKINENHIISKLLLR